MGADGKVIAFDIQPLALAATEMLLKQKNIYQQVNLVLNGHEHIDKYALPETVDVTLIGSQADLYIAKQSSSNSVTVDVNLSSDVTNVDIDNSPALKKEMEKTYI